MKKIVYLLVSVVLVALVIVGLIDIDDGPTEEAPKNVITGPPIYIADMFATDDELWMLRAKDTLKEPGPWEYHLYRLGENDQQEYVRLFPATTWCWNEEKQKLFYLSESKKSIVEYDPATGNTKDYSLDETYVTICAAVGENIFLQQEDYGAVTMYSISTGEECVLNASGTVLGVYDERIVAWNPLNPERYHLVCYDYCNGGEIWRIDLPDLFSTQINPVICKNGDDLYLANKNGGYAYIIPNFTETGEWKKTELFAVAIGMISTGGYVICAKDNPNIIRFHAIYPDRTVVDLTKWEDINYYQSGSFLMEVFDGKLYYTLKTEDCLYSYNLNE